MNNARRYLLGMVAALALAGAASASGSAPDASISFSGGSVAAGVGVSFGDGTLHFRDKDYAFSVQGLNFVDVGASRVEGVGEVYNLSKAGDFAGNYVAAGAGATLAGGGSVAVLENEHGVIVHFQSTTVGLRLNASGSGVHVDLK